MTENNRKIFHVWSIKTVQFCKLYSNLLYSCNLIYNLIFNWNTVRSSICHVKKACMILHDFCAQRHPNPIPYRGTMTVISGPSHNIEKFMQGAHIFMWFVAKLLELFVGTVNSSARTKTGDRMQFAPSSRLQETRKGRREPYVGCPLWSPAPAFLVFWR